MNQGDFECAGVARRGFSRRGLLLAAATLSVAPMMRVFAAELSLFDPIRQASAPQARPEQSVLLAVTCAGQRRVAVGEAGLVVVSDDLGQTWRQVPTPVSVTLTQVTFATPLLGWAVGHAGVILHSQDGGNSWALQLDGRQAAQLSLAAAQHEAGHVDPASLAAARQRLTTARRWVAEGADKPLLDIHFFNEREGMAVGAYGLALYTRDGGEQWHSALDQLDNPQGLHLYRIATTPGQVFIAGEQGTLLRAERSHDAKGAAKLQFASVTTPYVGTYFDLLAIAEGKLVLLGLRGHGFCSEDAGRTWRALQLGAAASLSAGIWLPSAEGGMLVIADQNGRLLGSVDAGHTFAPLVNPGAFAISGLAPGAEDTLIVVGARGVQRVALAQASMESRT